MSESAESLFLKESNGSVSQSGGVSDEEQEDVRLPIQRYPSWSKTGVSESAVSDAVTFGVQIFHSFHCCACDDSLVFWSLSSAFSPAHDRVRNGEKCEEFFMFFRRMPRKFNYC